MSTTYVIVLWKYIQFKLKWLLRIHLVKQSLTFIHTTVHLVISHSPDGDTGA